MQPEYCPEVDLTESPVLSQYVQELDYLFDIVVGPVGSGKSTATCAKLMTIAMDEPVHPRDNIRYCRTAIIRNTSPELKATTIKTWLDLFPADQCGPIVYSSPITQTIHVPPEDNAPGMHFEIMFVALDKPGDVSKLKSWDITNAWINELSEVPMPLVRFLRRRLGRYPKKIKNIMPDGSDYEAKRPYMLGDTNAYDQDHELYKYTLDVPPGWNFRVQPPAVLEVKQLDNIRRNGRVIEQFECIEDDIRFKGRIYDGPAIQAAMTLWIVNPEAENLRYLRQGYYSEQLTGSKRSEIERDVQAKFVYSSDGKAVIPEFSQQMHVREFPVLKDVELEIGTDIGGGTLNPAAVICQWHPRGTLLIHDEVFGEMGVDRFSPELKRKLNAEHFKGAPMPAGGRGLSLHTDPAGEKRDEIFETAVFDHLIDRGWNVQPAWSNAPNLRIEAVQHLCQTLVDQGVPALLVHPRCKGVIKALAGKWQFRRMQISGEERFHDKPDKNHPWSDIGDSVGYIAMSRTVDKFRRQNAQAQHQANIADHVLYHGNSPMPAAQTNFDPLK